VYAKLRNFTLRINKALGIYGKRVITPPSLGNCERRHISLTPCCHDKCCFCPGEVDLVSSGFCGVELCNVTNLFARIECHLQECIYGGGVAYKSS